MDTIVSTCRTPSKEGEFPGQSPVGNIALGSCPSMPICARLFTDPWSMQQKDLVLLQHI
jgi:hypothetical protein